MRETNLLNTYKIGLYCKDINANSSGGGGGNSDIRESPDSLVIEATWSCSDFKADSAEPEINAEDLAEPPANLKLRVLEKT